MSSFARLTFGAATVALISAVPAAAGLSGNFTVTFYDGPTHSKTSSLCVTFTNTGNIVGFPDSGTWAASGNPDIGGNFVVDGKMLRWYGTSINGTEVLNFYNSIKEDIPGRGGVDAWDTSVPPIRPVGDGTTRLRAGCR